jgi:hypothetical protein
MIMYLVALIWAGFGLWVDQFVMKKKESIVLTELGRKKQREGFERKR